MKKSQRNIYGKLKKIWLLDVKPSTTAQSERLPDLKPRAEYYGMLANRAIR